MNPALARHPDGPGAAADAGQAGKNVPACASMSAVVVQ